MKDRNKIAIGAMAMDLKRVCLCYYNGSENTAKRFCEEALKRKAEIDKDEVKVYLKKFIDDLPKVLHQKDKLRLAEDALMYSTLFQNYAVQK
jgi:hypothetical protein